jgi:hypothetical protein
MGCKKMSKYFPDIPTLPNECILLFAVFLRFEYALKKHRKFLENDTENKKCKASWTKFGNNLGPKFFSKIQEMKIAEKLLTHPPGEQIVGPEGVCTFQNYQLPQKSADLLLAVCRVRNNLFHGGKQPFDASRDTDLIAESLNVLGEALEYDKEMKETFYKAIG